MLLLWEGRGHASSSIIQCAAVASMRYCPGKSIQLVHVLFTTDASWRVLGASAQHCCVLDVLCAESASRSGFGKGFKPQVAPLSSLLGKLQARQAALGAK